MKTIPYHENVPSFGDWGYIMAWNDGREPPGLTDVTLKVETAYVTRETVAASLVFGKDALATKQWDVNTRMRPTLLRFYSEGWQVD
jgi:spermidine synthase